MMRISILFLLLFTITLFPQHKKVGKKNLGTLKIENTESFFSNIYELKSPPERGEFEPLEEYQKRLPKPFDTTKIYYLKLLGTQIVGYDYTGFYKYDIDKQKLTFVGEEDRENNYSELYSSSKFNAIKKCPCEVLEAVEASEHIASNGFGAETTVKKFKMKKYLLNLTNIDSLECLPDSILTNNGDHSILKMTLTSPPKEAEKLSKDVSLVMGFTTTGPLDIDLSCTLHDEATFTSPTEQTNFLYWINAKFTSLLLYNNKTGKVLARYDFPGKKEELSNK